MPAAPHPEAPDGPVLLGVVNAGSESFSGNAVASDGAADLAARLVADGAGVLDVGAQSLRTDQDEIPEEVEVARLVPALEAITQRCPGVPISLDAYRPGVLAAVLHLGVAILNDTSGRTDPDSAALAAEAGLEVVVTYNPGPVKQRRPPGFRLDDPVGGCEAAIAARMEQLAGHGVPPDRVVLDPGPDIYKPPDQTVELLRAVPALRDRLGVGRVLWAVSRKDFVGAVLGVKPAERGAGTLGALAALEVADGDLVRVHDVRAAADFYRVRRAVERGLPPEAALTDDLRYDRG